MSRQEDAARALEEAAADAVRIVEAYPDAKWHSVVASEDKTAAAVASHCALGNDVSLGWMCQLLAGRPIYETADTHDASNQAEAVRAAHTSKAEVISALQRTTRRNATFLRALTDEELERSATFGVSGKELSIGRFISNSGRHIRAHMESLRPALAE